MSSHPLESDSSPTPSRRRAASWTGYFDSVDEFDGPVRQIDGALPEGLVGTLYRNGPGRRDFSPSLFDGDGMIRALCIDGEGGAHLRTRFVETPKRRAEAGRLEPLQRTVGANVPGGFLRNAFRSPGHEANTHVVEHAGRLLALAEGGHPFEIDPVTLATGSMLDLDGALRRFQPYAAHPHFDAGTGETFNFGITFASLKPAIQTFRLDPAGRLHRLGRATLPYASFVHDFALSPRYMVFHVPPLTAGILRFLLGFDSLFETLQWRPEELPAQFLLMPRDGSSPIALDADPMLIGHFVGAWEEGGELIVDVCRFDEWTAIGEDATRCATSDWAGFGGGSIWRYRIDLGARRARGEELCSLPADFPRLHPMREATATRFAWAGCNTQPGEGGLYHAVLKLDRRSGATQWFDFGSNAVSLEPVFAPRPGARDEDDGWVLCMVYDAKRRASDVVILDGRRIEDGPVCTLRLPINAGTTFHGSWVPAG